MSTFSFVICMRTLSAKPSPGHQTGPRQRRRELTEILQFRLSSPEHCRDMSVTDLSYFILRPGQMAEVHDLMYQSFHLDEPMTNHLKLCQVSAPSPLL